MTELGEPGDSMKELREIIPWHEPRCSKHGACSYKCRDCIIILKLYDLAERLIRNEKE